LITGENSIQSTRQIRDFVLYLTGSLVLALIAIIRLPVLTNHFTPAEFGIFSLVTITYIYLSVALYNWISSCMYRYYHEYRENQEQAILLSNLIFLFLAASAILLLVTVTWFGLAGSKAVRHLLIPAFGYLFTNQLFNMFLVVYKLQGKALNYNLYQVVQACISFLLILMLIFWMDQQIEAIFMGQIFINVLLLSILMIRNKHVLKMISPGFVSLVQIRKLIQYGFIGFVSSAGIFVLISSDRYIIALFEDIDRVGIYNQVYQVGQVSVYFMVTVFFNTITPGLNKLLTGYTREGEEALRDYICAYVLLLLPVTFYVSIFAEQVSEFLLGESFRQGYTMIPWIVFSSFIYGLTLFNETRMKFEQRFKPVVWGVVAACTLNVGLNFILVPRLGYAVAAFTTFTAYLFLFIYYYLKDEFAFLQNSRLIRIILISSTVLIAQGLVDYIIRKVLGAELNKWLTLLEAILFSAFYFALIIRLKLFHINISGRR
jgi:O-antigen/teichoic acid export membrane protein